MKRIPAVILAGAVASMASSALAGPDLAPGDRFPSLVLPDLEQGRPTSLEDFRGKKLVLHIFASW